MIHLILLVGWLGSDENLSPIPSACSVVSDGNYDGSAITSSLLTEKEVHISLFSFDNFLVLQPPESQYNFY